MLDIRVIMRIYVKKSVFFAFFLVFLGIGVIKDVGLMGN